MGKKSKKGTKKGNQTDTQAEFTSDVSITTLDEEYPAHQKKKYKKRSE